MWLKILIVFSLTILLESSDPRRLFSSPLKADSLDSPEEDFNYRLPNNTRPIKYNLFMTTDIHKDERDFEGKVEIQIKVLEDSDHITIHSRQIKINNVDLLNSSSSLIESNVTITYRQQVEFLIIKPTIPLLKGVIYWVVINYEGQLRDDNMGFYRSTYIDKNGKEVPYAATKFEPHNARHAFPWLESLKYVQLECQVYFFFKL
jgi:aminopeptidase N